MSRFVRQIPLWFHPGSMDTFLAIEAWNIDGQAAVRLTVSHPDPDRHIAVAMHVDETFNLISVLLQAFSEAFLKERLAPPAAGGSSEPGGER